MNLIIFTNYLADTKKSQNVRRCPQQHMYYHCYNWLGSFMKLYFVDSLFHYKTDDIFRSIDLCRQEPA